MKGAVLCQGPSQSPPQFASVQQSSAQLHPLVLQPSLGPDIPGSGRCAWHEPGACWAPGAALVLLGGALHSLALSRAEVVAHAGSTDWWTNKSFHLWLQQSAILQSLRLWVKRTSLSPCFPGQLLLFSHFQCRNGSHLQGAFPCPSPFYQAASPLPSLLLSGYREDGRERSQGLETPLQLGAAALCARCALSSSKALAKEKKLTVPLRGITHLHLP